MNKVEEENTLAEWVLSNQKYVKDTIYANQGKTYVQNKMPWYYSFFAFIMASIIAIFPQDLGRPPSGLLSKLS